MSISDSAFAGKPLSCRVIDAHTHIGPYNLNGWHQQQGSATCAAQIADMDRLGIDCIVTAPHTMVQGWMREANEEAARAARDFPGRIYGYISVVPQCGLQEVREELRKYERNPAFVGLKFLTGYHGELLQPEYEYALDFADELGCPVLCHNWGEVPPTAGFDTALRTRHRLSLILAHQAGGSAVGTRNTRHLFAEHENIYMELCGSLYNQYAVEELVAMTGEERVIFGTDAVDLDPKYELGRVAFARMEDRVKQMVFAGNYLRLLEKSSMGEIRF